MRHDAYVKGKLLWEQLSHLPQRKCLLSTLPPAFARLLTRANAALMPCSSDVPAHSVCWALVGLKNTGCDPNSLTPWSSSVPARKTAQLYMSHACPSITTSKMAQAT